MVEPRMLQAAKVAARDDADDPPPLRDRQMPDAAILHQAERFNRCLAWTYCRWICRHYISQKSASCAFALREYPANSVASGENADKMSISARYQRCTYIAAAHFAARILHCRGRREHKRVLVVNDIKQVPFHCTTFCPLRVNHLDVCNK